MSVGAMITAARDAAGLSVDEVSEKTRIRATVVRAIEVDDFSHCGGDVYARGHLRSIAAAVGLEPGPVLAEFDASHSTSGPSATAVFEAETLTAPGRGPNWSAILAVALVVAIGLVGFQVFRGGDDARERTTYANPAPTPPTTPPESSEPTPDTSESQVAQAPDEVTVRLTAVPGGVSWVQVSDHADVVLFTGELGDGQSKTFKDDKKLQIVLGNAAGVSLEVNGTDLGTPGASGEVARLSFTPEDPDGTAG